MQTKGLSKCTDHIQTRSMEILSIFFFVIQMFSFVFFFGILVPILSIQDTLKPNCADRRHGYFRKNITFAQQEIADFGILTIKNNYNITSMTFGKNPKHIQHAHYERSAQFKNYVWSKHTYSLWTPPIQLDIFLFNFSFLFLLKVHGS